MFSSPFPPSGFHTAHKKLLSLELAGGGGVGGLVGDRGSKGHRTGVGGKKSFQSAWLFSL